MQKWHTTVIVATIHEDVVDCLMPDCVLCPGSGRAIIRAPNGRPCVASEKAVR